MCDTPPVLNRKMTRFAFGAKCGAFGASGSSSGERRGLSPPSSANNSDTIAGNTSDPPTIERRTARRVGRRSLDIHELVAEPECARDAFPRLLRVRKLREVCTDDRALLVAGRASEEQLEGAVDSR